MSDSEYDSEDDLDYNPEYGTAEELINGLKENKYFTALLHTKQEFTSLQADAIADALDKNTRLEELRMPFSRCGGTRAKLIGDAIGKNTTLEHLVLGFRDDDLEQISDGLGKSQSLISLQVLEVAAKGAAAIGKVLSHTSTLKELNLNDKEDEGGVEFGDEGAMAIAEGLLNNKSLEKLRLVRCGFESKGAVSIAKSLENHPNMKKINIAGNFIGEAGACAIAKAIAKNRALAKIRIGGPVSERFGSHEGVIYSDDRFRWSDEVFASFGRAFQESIPRATTLTLRGLSIDGYPDKDDEVVAHLEGVWAHPPLVVAFGMGLNNRLGKGSLVQRLDGDIFKLIATLAFPDTLGYDRVQGKTNLMSLTSLLHKNRPTGRFDTQCLSDIIYEMMRSKAPLPPGWERKHDQESYRFFYENASLDKRQWKRPE